MCTTGNTYIGNESVAGVFPRAISVVVHLYSYCSLVCRDPSSRLSRIKTLINEAERDLYRLRENFTSQNATSGVKDAEKKYKRGERRLQLYKLMQQNFERAGRQPQY